MIHWPHSILSRAQQSAACRAEYPGPDRAQRFAQVGAPGNGASSLMSLSADYAHSMTEALFEQGTRPNGMKRVGDHRDTVPPSGLDESRRHARFADRVPWLRRKADHRTVAVDSLPVGKHACGSKQHEFSVVRFLKGNAKFCAFGSTAAEDDYSIGAPGLFLPGPEHQGQCCDKQHREWPERHGSRRYPKAVRMQGVARIVPASSLPAKHSTNISGTSWPVPCRKRSDRSARPKEPAIISFCCTSCISRKAIVLGH